MPLDWLAVKQVVACAADLVAELVAEHFVGHFGVVAVADAVELPLVVHCVELVVEPAVAVAVAVRVPVDEFAAGLVVDGLVD